MTDGADGCLPDPTTGTRSPSIGSTEKLRAALDSGERIDLVVEDVAGSALQAVDKALTAFSKDVVRSARAVADIFTAERRELAASST